MTEKKDDNKLIAERRAKLADIRAEGRAFPNDFRREDFASDLQAELGDKDKESLEILDRKAAIAGRIMAKRGPFIVLQDPTGRIQMYVDKKTLDASVVSKVKTWDIGDIVFAKGPVHKSGKGDLYILAAACGLLTKSLRPLPDKYHGLTDQEMRYRQRYVDLIMNQDSRELFVKRSKIIEAIRHFLLEKDFLEVETPMMQVIPGGASAKPFVTHHNALDREMYLRIAPELYLKRLVVGGFERVFEINRNFRNEGLSTRHNPEFTMLEFYQAYADYNDLMDITEAMLRHVAETVMKTTDIVNTKRNAEGDIVESVTYNFAKSFARMSVYDSILHFNKDINPEHIDTLDAATKLCESLGVEVKPYWGLGKLHMEIFDETVEHLLIQPTFITQYPTEVSPLARRNDDNPFVTDRFEFFVGGREIANGFSELNDAEDQDERFKKQVAEKDAGDEEAMHYDADYIRALEYGMAPTAGEGIGIDRLVMLFTDAPSIRDVLLFPHMRPESTQTEAE